MAALICNYLINYNGQEGPVLRCIVLRCDFQKPNPNFKRRPSGPAGMYCPPVTLSGQAVRTGRQLAGCIPYPAVTAVRCVDYSNWRQTEPTNEDVVMNSIIVRSQIMIQFIFSLYFYT